MKKKIVILSLRGGFGHISTSNALYQQLKSQYNVHVAFLFEDVLENIDCIAKLTKNRFSFPKLYNFIIQRRMSFLMNILYWIACHFFPLLRSRMAKSLQVFFDQQKPDLIISVVPLVNSQIAAYTKQNEIPFILIPTDIDAQFFLGHINENLHNKMLICPMIFNDFVKNQLQKNGISITHIYPIGAILRADFFEDKNIAVIKKQYNLPFDKPILMVMMGGIGSTKILPIAKTIASLSFPLHVILCTGKDTDVTEQLKKLAWNKKISYTILGFTERISDLMAASDVLFTKSGTLTVLEGLYMKKIMLLDGIGSVLPWERYNHTLTAESGFGYSIKNYKQLKQKLFSLLQNKHEYEKIKTNLDQFERKNGAKEIEIILQQIL